MSGASIHDHRTVGHGLTIGRLKGVLEVTMSGDFNRTSSLETGAVPQRADGRTDLSQEVRDLLAEDRDCLARDLNDTLVHQMFAVSLDLHAALSRIEHHAGDLQAAEKIRQAINGLDQAIGGLRNSIVGRGEPGSPQRHEPCRRTPPQ